jgi:nucleoside-diphosphate-sugar epimerase
LKVLVFGSNGLVGNSLRRNFSNSEEYECLFSTREDTNLFSFQDTKKTISKFNPDLIINAAAKVGGIYANDTQGTSFLIENLKININILESIINLPKVSLINLGSSCIYPLNAPNPISEISIKELAEKIKLTIGFNGKLNFDSTMPDGNPRKLLDSSLINKNGWFPKIDLDQGLKDTYSWYLENS